MASVMMNAALFYLFMMFICWNAFDCSNVPVIGLIVTVIVQQLFSLGLFVLQMAMGIHTWITLTLSITNMALFFFFYVVMFRFAVNMCVRSLEHIYTRTSEIDSENANRMGHHINNSDLNHLHIHYDDI